MGERIRRFVSERYAFMKTLAVYVAGSDILFWAGAISFNLLVAFIPLVLFVAGLGGFVLSARFGGRPTPALLDILSSYLPVLGGDIQLTVVLRDLLQGLIEARGQFLGIGALFLVWISARLFGTLRTVLRYVFQLEDDRGIIKGVLFDLAGVVVGGALLVLNVGVTVAIGSVQAYGADQLGLGTRWSDLLQAFTGQLISFASAWALFLLLYRYLPARRIPFRSAAVGATFSAVLFELVKGAFAWYVTSVADYSNVYGSLTVVAILFFWIYYSSIVFILGGQAARIHEVRRT